MNMQGIAPAGMMHGYRAESPVHSRPGGTAAVNEACTALSGTRVSFSDQAQALSGSDTSPDASLESIKAKPAAQRSPEEAAIVQPHDARFAEIAAKDPQTRTADEVDYIQKAGGLVNTMANLSPDERMLYDDLVAKGDTEAVRGLNLVALSRMGRGEVTLPDGRRFDPDQTAITADNVRALFSRMFVGADGQDSRSFEALAIALGNRQTLAA